MVGGDGLSTALYSAGAGASALAAIQLFRLTPATKAYQAAAAFFVLLCAIAAANVLSLWIARMPAWAAAAPGALVAALVPFLRLYVDDLTAETPQVWGARDALHFGPALIMAAIAASLAVFPDELQRAVTSQPLSTIGQIYAWISTSGLVLMILQSSYYLYVVFNRLLRLRARLRQVFASTEEREQTWLQLLTGLFVFNWALTIAYNLGLWAGSDLVFSLSGLVFIMVMASWAMRQTPSFQDSAQPSTRLKVPQASDAPAAGPKYERSLLEDERLDKIAARIDQAFQREQLHLDPALSLKKLSEKTGVSESNLSQTFSRRLAASFFDYVNRWRIEDAKARLLTSDATIAEVAFDAGFNSRSAFYNAFKAETGQTPASFRDLNQGLG